jgi:hypothetical protein
VCAAKRLLPAPHSAASERKICIDKSADGIGFARMFVLTQLTFGFWVASVVYSDGADCCHDKSNLYLHELNNSHCLLFISLVMFSCLLFFSFWFGSFGTDTEGVPLFQKCYVMTYLWANAGARLGEVTLGMVNHEFSHLCL